MFSRTWGALGPMLALLACEPSSSDVAPASALPVTSNVAATLRAHRLREFQAMLDAERPGCAPPNITGKEIHWRVEKLGRMLGFEPPSDWLEMPAPSDLDTTHWRGFQAPDASGAQLILVRELPLLSIEKTAALRARLLTGPKKLPRKDLQDLGLFDHRLKDPKFNLREARVEDLRGTRMIVVEGHDGTTKLDVFEGLLQEQQDTSQTAVQRVTLRVPAKLFSAARDDLMSRLRSMYVLPDCSCDRNDPLCDCWY